VHDESRDPDSVKVLRLAQPNQLKATFLHQ